MQCFRAQAMSYQIISIYCTCVLILATRVIFKLASEKKLASKFKGGRRSAFLLHAKTVWV